MPLPPASLKWKLRLESLDERVVPDGGGTGDPPPTDPPQAGDPAAQIAQTTWAYVVAADGSLSLMLLGLSGPDTQQGLPFTSKLDTATGMILSDTGTASSPAVVVGPASPQPNTAYSYDPANEQWTAAAITGTTILSPASGFALTPLLAADGLGTAWAIHPEAMRVAATAPPPGGTVIPAPPAPPSPNAQPIWLPPGTVITLANGTTYTFPGGGYMYVNPNDNGFWLYPNDQPAVIQPPGGGPPSNLNPGQHTDIPPQFGGSLVVPPGAGPPGWAPPSLPQGNPPPGPPPPVWMPVPQPAATLGPALIIPGDPWLTTQWPPRYHDGPFSWLLGPINPWGSAAPWSWTNPFFIPPPDH